MILESINIIFSEYFNPIVVAFKCVQSNAPHILKTEEAP